MRAVGTRAEIKLRVGPALLAAVRARAAEQGLSLNSFVAQILASAVGTGPFEPAPGDPGGSDPSRADADTGWVEPLPAELGYLRSAYQGAHWGTMDAIELFLITDEQVLAWDRAGRPRPHPHPDQHPPDPDQPDPNQPDPSQSDPKPPRPG